MREEQRRIAPLFFRDSLAKKEQARLGAPQAGAEGVFSYADVTDEEQRRIAPLFFFNYPFILTGRTI
jgi:hypothetical protein